MAAGKCIALIDFSLHIQAASAGGRRWLLADGYRLVGPGSRLQVLACMFTTSGCRRRTVAVGSGAAIAAQWLPHCQL